MTVFFSHRNNWIRLASASVVGAGLAGLAQQSERDVFADEENDFGVAQIKAQPIVEGKTGAVDVKLRPGNENLLSQIGHVIGPTPLRNLFWRTDHVKPVLAGLYHTRRGHLFQ